jgi:hypothetical protein
MPPLQQEKHRILLCTELTAGLVAFSPALDYSGGGPTVWDISEREVNSSLVRLYPKLACRNSHFLEIVSRLVAFLDLRVTVFKLNIETH